MTFGGLLVTQVRSKPCVDILKQFMCSANNTLFCWVFDFVLIPFGIVFLLLHEKVINISIVAVVMMVIEICIRVMNQNFLM
jgi:hypothetical protein